MNSQIFIYIVFLAVSGVLSLFIGVFAFIRRKNFLGSTMFILISLFSSIYTFGHAFELSSQSLSMIVFWTYFQYLGLPYIAPLSLLLVTQYIGAEKYMTKKNVITAFSIPVLTTLIVLTNQFHHLFYQTIYLKQGIAPLLGFVLGPWYIVHGSYTFACLLVGGILLLHYWKQTKSTYWKQTLVMLLGLYLPMIASFFYLIGLVPFSIDPVPVVLSVTAALYIWAFSSTNLFDLAPIARGLIFDSMRDGVVVLDQSKRIIDFNYAATSLINKLDDSMVGKKMDLLWEGNHDSSAFPFHLLDSKDYESEFELEWHERNQYYQLRSSPIKKRSGDVVGNTIVILDVTEQRRLQKRLERLAYIDQLTNILNRSAFLEESIKLVKEMRNKDQTVVLILFDIDHFKQINDTYGHHIGDEAIRHVVRICKQLLQPNDLFGRYGGEEFVLCLPSMTLEEAGEYADMMRKSIENEPLVIKNETIHITASFGVTKVIEENMITDALNLADKALYASKRTGRNSVYIENGKLIDYKTRNAAHV
ncbi:histidine kinase N-terminal 7TM domain-containing protein [Metabacillus sp. YM-086]|uniref:histidine kinase N-terminal 7TM domain-containing diguanylate cyclase n=1 Tax=Metabacillus sp. YM-086 TaxID=3341729 RepID=UPI003A8A7C75